MNDFTQIVEQVDKRIAAKRARLLQLLNDPDLTPYVNVLLVTGHAITKSRSKTATVPVQIKNGNGIREAIRKLLNDDNHPFFEMRQFGRDNVKNFLDDCYGKDTYSLKAVGDALYHLTKSSKDKVLRKVQEGKGGKPTLYERI